MSCKGCTKRQVEPNCHDYCEEYLAEKKERSEMRQKMFDEKSINSAVRGLHINRSRTHKWKKREN